MSHLAYPPRLPIDFSESIAQLIKLTLRIKHEAAINKNELEKRLAKGGGATYFYMNKLDARGVLLHHQIRKSRMWVSISGGDIWLGESELGDAEKFALSDALLRNLEVLFRTLQNGRICPMTKVTTLHKQLARRPIITVRQLSEDAIVSETTAKRWLKNLEQQGVVTSHLKDGQRQFVNEGLVALLNKFV